MNYILKKKYNFIMLATVITGLAFSSTANAFDKTKCYEIKTWGENDRKGEIGQVFQYKNPKTKDIEFFELVKLGKDKKYWYFPTDKSNNKYWSYLGTDNPNEISIHRWGENDRKGEIGQVFQYKNPKTKDIEFFELVKLGKDKKYWYFPTDKSNNKYWNYLGTEKPTKDCTTVVDSIAPVITIVGANPTNITVNSDYNDLGATAIDDIDGDISANIEVTGKVDTSKIGKYKVTYSVSDKAGNKITATRVVLITTITSNKIKPLLNILGANPISINKGDNYIEEGATAIDDISGDISSEVIIAGEVNTNKVGKYILTYKVTDESGNQVEKTREVRVVAASEKVIKLPPDPGEAGKKTLAGIDSNNNGIRDDVEIAIYNRYPDYYEMRKTLEQSARSTQASILAGASGSVVELEAAGKQSSRSADCFVGFISTSLNMDYTPLAIFIENTVVNTEERAKAYIKDSAYWSGKIIKGNDDDEPCDWK